MQEQQKRCICLNCNLQEEQRDASALITASARAATEVAGICSKGCGHLQQSACRRWLLRGLRGSPHVSTSSHPASLASTFFYLQLSPRRDFSASPISVPRKTTKLVPPPPVWASLDEPAAVQRPSRPPPWPSYASPTPPPSSARIVLGPIQFGFTSGFSSLTQDPMVRDLRLQGESQLNLFDDCACFLLHPASMSRRCRGPAAWRRRQRRPTWPHHGHVGEVARREL